MELTHFAESMCGKGSLAALERTTAANATMAAYYQGQLAQFG